MTNEEKILDILAGMSLRLDSMATREDLQNEILKINIRLETEVQPRLDALAEGHGVILDRRSMSEEIQNLKKAQ